MNIYIAVDPLPQLSFGQRELNISMKFFSSTLALSIYSVLLVVASPAPLHISQLYSESKPWLLSNITVFTARAASPGVSYINFQFTDNNTGIEMTTQCSRFILPDDDGSIVDSANYYLCENSTVEFQYTGSAIYIGRSYTDPS